MRPEPRFYDCEQAVAHIMRSRASTKRLPGCTARRCSWSGRTGLQRVKPWISCCGRSAG